MIAIVLCAACSLAPTTGSPAASPSALVSATQMATRSTGEHAALPSGFPVLPGAVPAVIADDDPGLIAEWTSDRLGSAAYDFYATTLAASGYPIIGLYPGGEVAVIRFRAPDGAIWQMVAHGGANRVATIEIRLDRP